ncbi:hypothetical protein [Halorhabdus rudnickae]|uniref:hypothetical protein n=1 Tax=Halorhabdus rudnickae TaxID=1775544 RepID=UPI0010844BDE|nr:hypothetical protein [Halorhabdus rudnickae]
MQPRGAFVVLLVVLALVAVPALAYATAGVDGESAATAEVGVAQVTGGNASEGTFGSQMSAFMQSSAATASDSVETGMWVQRVDENASTAARQVQSRTERLENRLQRLEASLDRMQGQGVNVTDPATAGEVARLTTRVRNLQRSINETERVADRTGVNAVRLDRLRTEAANLSGHEVASMARNLSLGPPDGVPGGPPANAPAGPPDDNETGPPANAPAGPPTNDTAGPPDDNGAGPPDDDETGPPDDDETGPPDDGETGPSNDGETGPPDDDETGPSNDGGTGPPDDDETGPSNDGGTGPPDDGAGPPDERST